MIQEFTSKITSKGQVTVPIELRRALKLTGKDDKLRILYDTVSKKATIEPALSFEEIRKLSAKFLKPNIKPLENPRALYETREPAK